MCETNQAKKELHYIVAYYRERWGFDTTNVFAEKFDDIPKKLDESFIPNPKKPKPMLIVLGAVLADMYEPSMFTDKKLIALVDKIDPDWVAKKA